MGWADEVLKEMWKDSTWLTGKQVAEARNDGFVTKDCKSNWYVGKTVDLYTASDELGFTGTVAEIYPDGKCLIEIW